MKFYLKIILIIFICTLGLNSCLNFAADCSNIPGKYYDVRNNDLAHFVELYVDGTFLHYCKKENKEYSHTGKWWKKKACTIELDSWKIYNEQDLDDFLNEGGLGFNSSLGNMLFWPTKKYLEDHIDGGNKYVKEKYVKSYLKEKEQSRIYDSIYWATKDTLFYKTGEVKEIGKISNKRKYGVWEEYYKSFVLKAEGKMIYDGKESIWKHYYESGELEAIGAYESNYKTGAWEYYYKNGKLKETGVFMGGRKFNPWKLYNNTGKHIRTKKHRNRRKKLDSMFRIEYKMNPLYIEENIEEAIERMDSPFRTYKEALEKEAEKLD